MKKINTDKIALAIMAIVLAVTAAVLIAAGILMVSDMPLSSLIFFALSGVSGWFSFRMAVAILPAMKKPHYPVPVVTLFGSWNGKTVIVQRHTFDEFQGADWTITISGKPAAKVYREGGETAENLIQMVQFCLSLGIPIEYLDRKRTKGGTL